MLNIFKQIHTPEAIRVDTNFYSLWTQDESLRFFIGRGIWTSHEPNLWFTDLYCRPLALLFKGTAQFHPPQRQNSVFIWTAFVTATAFATGAKAEQGKMAVSYFGKLYFEPLLVGQRNRTTGAYAAFRLFMWIKCTVACFTVAFWIKISYSLKVYWLACQKYSWPRRWLKTSSLLVTY